MIGVVIFLFSQFPNFYLEVFDRVSFIISSSEKSAHANHSHTKHTNTKKNIKRTKTVQYKAVRFKVACGFAVRASPLCFDNQLSFL